MSSNVRAANQMIVIAYVEILRRLDAWCVGAYYYGAQRGLIREGRGQDVGHMCGMTPPKSWPRDVWPRDMVVA